jgi:thiol-disulfide isomerase/thioredoxin
MGKRIYNLEFFKKLAISKNGECLSTEYIACDKKLKFKCSFGHIWETKPYYLVNNNSWCPQCNKSHKDKIETFQKIAIENGGECLSTEYINAKNKLKFKCGKGHIWESTANDIKYSKVWCPYCSNNAKLTIEEMQEIANKRGGKCLSETYIDSHTKLLWECKHGHQWMAKPCQIKNSNNWCPICKESLGERTISNYLKQNNILFEREKKFNDCKGKRQVLPFDFYLPEYSILIEFDGRQHYVPVNFYGCSNKQAQKTHIELIENDKLKNKYCIENNIQLIRIPHTIKNIEEHLNSVLK